MNKKIKVCVVVTARPSYSRVRSALYAIREHNDLELSLVVAGSALLDRYGDVSSVIEKDGFTIDEKVYVVLEGENPTIMAKSTGLAIVELASVFQRILPNMVVSIADRYETIATSIAAAYQNIPLIHIQGGEVTGSIDEKVRHANTKIADIHLVASEDARERVIKLGEPAESVFNTGCPSNDIAFQAVNGVGELDFNPVVTYGGVGAELDLSDGYIVVMQHPVTSEYNSTIYQIRETLNAIEEIGIATYWFWPNVDAGSDVISSEIRKYREHNRLKNVHFFKNMEPYDFIKLVNFSKCLVGNSSVGIRECSLLGVPVVDIGTRQSGRMRATNVLSADYDNESIVNAVETQLRNGRYPSSTIYGDGAAGERIAEILSGVQINTTKKITY